LAGIHVSNLQHFSSQSRHESDDANAIDAKLISRFPVEAKEALVILHLLLVGIQRPDPPAVLLPVLEPDDPSGDLPVEVADQRAKAALRAYRLRGQAKIL
jgi:hypothetical protein